MPGGYENIWPSWMVEEILNRQKEEEVKPNKLFAYGILKKGFSLDLSREGAKFIGEAILQPANLYSIGAGVGLLLEDEGKVHGEVFEIPERMWKWLDQIEGHPHLYQRQRVWPVLAHSNDEIEAYVYVYQRPEYLGRLIESGNYDDNSGYARG